MGEEEEKEKKKKMLQEGVRESRSKRDKRKGIKIGQSEYRKAP